MNRQIKFRSWNVDEKIMHDIAMPSWNGSHEVWQNNKPQTETQWLSNGPADEGVLMQYVGMEDVNGKEVYEGDIFKNVDTGELCVCEYEKGKFISNYGSQKHYGTDNERKFTIETTIGNLHTVVGNIFENPELKTILLSDGNFFVSFS